MAIAFNKFLDRDAPKPITGNRAFTCAHHNRKTTMVQKSQLLPLDLIRLEDPGTGNLRNDEKEQLRKTKKKTTTNTKAFFTPSEPLKNHQETK